MTDFSSCAYIGTFLSGFIPLYHAFVPSPAEKIETIKNALIQVELFYDEVKKWFCRAYIDDLLEVQRKYYRLVEIHLFEAIKFLERLGKDGKLLAAPLYEIQNLSKHIPSYLEFSKDFIRMTGLQRADNIQKFHKSEELVLSLSIKVKNNLSKLLFPSIKKKLLLCFLATFCFVTPFI